MAISFEILQCLDKKSVLFLRSYIRKESEAWNVLCRRFQSFDKPFLQKLIMNFKNLWKYSNENIVIYITRAEDMQLNFFEVDESISEKMFFRYLWRNFLVNLIVFALWWNMV